MKRLHSIKCLLSYEIFQTMFSPASKIVRYMWLKAIFSYVGPDLESMMIRVVSCSHKMRAEASVVATLGLFYQKKKVMIK